MLHQRCICSKAGLVQFILMDSTRLLHHGEGERKGEVMGVEDVRWRWGGGARQGTPSNL